MNAKRNNDLLQFVVGLEFESFPPRLANLPLSTSVRCPVEELLQPEFAVPPTHQLGQIVAGMDRPRRDQIESRAIPSMIGHGVVKTLKQRYRSRANGLGVDHRLPRQVALQIDMVLRLVEVGGD